jgi:uncharacterized protein (UPF0305 family)
METLVQTREERMRVIEEEMRALRAKFEEMNKDLVDKELSTEERERLLDELTPERSRELLKGIGFTTYSDENGVEQPL